MAKTVTEALDEVGSSWAEGEQFPSWVDLPACELDQFYTLPSRAARLIEDAVAWIIEHDPSVSSVDDILFVEPSAGSGSFARALPHGSVLMDIDPAPASDEIPQPIIKQDFLTWDADACEAISHARESGKKIVAIGNPPFGTRGWMALSFMNKVATFADYAAFILPMSFGSEGKGSPKYRVQGIRCAASKELLREEFAEPDGSTRTFNVIWQIWERGENKKPDYALVDERFEIKFICDLSYRRCGQAFKEKADIFVPQAYFPGTQMEITDIWDDVLYASAYGARAKDPSETDDMIEALRGADWDAHTTSSTHGCRHVGMSEIKQVLAEAFGIDVL